MRNVVVPMPVPLTPPPISEWRQIMRQNFTRWDRLADFLELTAKQRESILINPQFALNLPMRLAKKIPKGTLEDPILRQFLPTLQEENEIDGFVQDPVGDCGAQKTPKLLQKYQGRVLLVCTSACAMHCRYCFRQNYDYEVEDRLFDEEIDLIAQDPSIHEVILSGGDPLSLSDRALDALFEKLDGIPHIRRIRIHTRFPIGIPERLDASFLEILRRRRSQLCIVVHVNHPRELDEDVVAYLKGVQTLGVMILNQSVLLRGVNDNIGTLTELCESLVDVGIVPYYLHQLDRVKGAAHFEVSQEEALELMTEISKRLPGYAVPKYVYEEAGMPNKTRIF